MVLYVILVLYCVGVLIGVHVAIDFLSTTLSKRRLDYKDISYAFCCIFLNYFSFFLCRPKKYNRVTNKTPSMSESEALSVIQLYIPFFINSLRLSSLISSKDPASYLLGKELLKDKYSDYLIRKSDYVKCAYFLANLKEIDLIIARYDIKTNLL